MKLFKKLNNIVGWSVFFIASFVYLSTIEQTVSFWDCGEYIATAYKLEVGHPPGAPLFQLFGRIFSLFATPGTSEVAVAINTLSALCSSFTILFLFWTITAFSKKIIIKNQDIKTEEMILILSSGLIGSLAYTFSDSFWFSAVEGEVYAMSSLFTAATFWCIMKWEEQSHKASSGRWLILIAYLIGLSIGVHLLSLLTIPAMGMIYYFKKYQYTKSGAIKAFFISIGILGLVQGIIIPGAVSLISKFELFFVNSIGLPFNSGAIIYLIAILCAIYFGLAYTKKNKKPLWNTFILSVTMLLIGYSSFAILVIRSNSNPPIDENNPEDAVGLLSYLKREQYGSWPIIYGRHFNAELDSRNPYVDGSPVYAKDEKKGKYIIIDNRKKSLPNYSKKDKMLFPRMWSNTQSRHANGYKMWADLKSKDSKPTFAQNLKFFFKYQIGWSYIRYFMWNFAGRQNDYMNMDGNSLHGNWESGIKFIDNARLGTPNSNDVIAPEYLANNKAKNHYYFLPLILGLIGMIYHFKFREQDAISVLLFFLFTGVLIIVYLNVVPFQPRERDYAYVGSFYAFSIWIGLGVLGVYNFLKENIKLKIPSKVNLITSILIAFFMAPALMFAKNWDDHDRSGRYTALEVAKNYLNSCDKNAILFTNGDNDTFPLWYAQEVEGIRTDIKVVNLSLFNTDWYIDQMKRASYDAQPIPSSLQHEDYRSGTRDYTPIFEKTKERVDVKQVVQFINSNNANRKIRTSGGLRNYCPTKKLKLEVNFEKKAKDYTYNLMKNMNSSSISDSIKMSQKIYTDTLKYFKSFIPEEYQNRIVDEIKWQLKGNGLYKNKLMVLDILANFNWERPIYFATTVGQDNFMGLEKYFQLEGLTYRLVPYIAQSPDRQPGVVHTEKMYQRLTKDFVWGGYNNPDNYFDETNTRMVLNFRNSYSRLAESLMQKQDTVKAIETLDKCISEFSSKVVPFSYYAPFMIDIYLRAQQKEKGTDILVEMIDRYVDEYKYLKAFKYHSGVNQNERIALQILGNLNQIISIHKLSDNGFNYFEKNGNYFMQKDNNDIEIDYQTFRINSFVSEFLEL